MRDLRDEELEESFELIRVASHRRRHRRRVDALRRLERAHVELQPVAELLDAAEPAPRVALAEARIEQLAVVPHARGDPPARVDELECEIRGAVSRPQTLLLRHRVDTVDRAVLLELRDRGHGLSLGAGTVGSMATIRPFRALRYDEAVAGPLASLVAPPYDVISAEQRVDYLARSPHNVVHLTLPDSEEQAARDLADWRESGALVEEQPAYWWLKQDYTGPDGVARSREGFVAALRAEPYDRHGRTDDLPHAPRRAVCERRPGHADRPSG